MQWLTLAYLISVGSMNAQIDTFSPYGNSYYSSPQNAFQTTLGVEAVIAEHFFVSGSVETWQKPDPVAFFDPLQSLYRFGAGVRINGFELGFRHECDHITLSSLSGPSMANMSGFMGAKTEFYFSYTGKINVF